MIYIFQVNALSMHPNSISYSLIGKKNKSVATRAEIELPLEHPETIYVIFNLKPCLLLSLPPLLNRYIKGKSLMEQI